MSPCCFEGTGHAAEARRSTDMRRKRARLQSGTFIAVVFLLIASCTSTKHYARRAETDRASYIAANKLVAGMSMVEVVDVMLDARLGGQYALLSSGANCPDVSTKLILHSGELLATVGGAGVYAGGFASIEIYRRADTSLSTFGFERQGAFREAVRAREHEFLVCSDAEMSFDATVEGGCGNETIHLKFDDNGVVSSMDL